MNENYEDKEGGALAKIGYGHLACGVSVFVWGRTPGVRTPCEVDYGTKTLDPVGQDKDERGNGDERSENRCRVHKIVHIKNSLTKEECRSGNCGDDKESR